MAKAESLPSTHPLYILYTSGTTGDPKGIVRDHGGTATSLNYSMRDMYNFKRGMCYFSPADLGWIVGHTTVCYGPLVRSMSSVIFEGKPSYPNPGIFWKIC